MVEERGRNTETVKRKTGGLATESPTCTESIRRRELENTNASVPVWKRAEINELEQVVTLAP